MRFEGKVWRLMQQEELLGEIVIDEADFPWLNGRFVPTPAFGAVKPWFDESLTLLEAEEYERFEASFSTSVTVVLGSGGVTSRSMMGEEPVPRNRSCSFSAVPVSGLVADRVVG